MKLIKNIRAISRLSLIILLLISFVVGAFLSYLWVMGHYLTLGIKIPDNTTLSISNVVFTNQNTTYFNVTFFNPSYSPSAAEITGIVVKTADNKIHNVTITYPRDTPYIIPKSQNKTFQCMWNWENYTGQIIGISAFIEEGSGPTFEALTPFVDLQVTDVHFDSSISITHFNLTIQSHESSVTYVNITNITVQANTLKAEKVIPSLPYTLNPNSSVTFKCLFDWTDYQNASIIIAVHTLQGYVSYTTHFTPSSIIVEVTDALFSEPDITHFIVTIRNSQLSPSYLNISEITLTLENETVVEMHAITPFLPYTLNPNSSKTFKCTWKWNIYRSTNVMISVHTLQNYTVYYATVTPSPIDIINAIFDPVNTNNFNLTIQNSEFYTTYVNLTDITLVLENGAIQSINVTQMEPSLPYTLNPNSSKTFECPWNWTNYQGKNVTIIVHSTENYAADFTTVTPTRVLFAIISVAFDPIGTKNFNITVRNSEFSLDDALITKIAVTLDNGTVIEISDVLPVLPYTLNSNSTAIFRCTWDWTNYRNKNIVITVHTRKGYIASTQYTTPPAFKQG